jgi:hypothetical protein
LPERQIRRSQSAERRRLICGPDARGADIILSVQAMEAAQKAYREAADGILSLLKNELRAIWW